MLILIKGAGDIATGIAVRLFYSKFKIIMTDIKSPTAIRRTVCFSQAIVNGSAQVEGISAVKAQNPQEALEIVKNGKIAVLADEKCDCLREIKPDVLVDAILAKKNLGTKITDAKLVIAAGPGFEAGKDCHAVIETMRGHYLGRVITSGAAIKNTGIPGNIGGFTVERIIRAPKDGIFEPVREIGDFVHSGETAAYVDGTPVKSQIDGILRGILPSKTPVFEGMKSGDVDPRCKKEHCYCVSDKALSVGGGVLEAILRFSNQIQIEI